MGPRPVIKKGDVHERDHVYNSHKFIILGPSVGHMGDDEGMKKSHEIILAGFLVFIFGVMSGLFWSFVQHERFEIRESARITRIHQTQLPRFSLKRCEKCHPEWVETSCDVCH